MPLSLTSLPAFPLFFETNGCSIERSPRNVDDAHMINTPTTMSPREARLLVTRVEDPLNEDHLVVVLNSIAQKSLHGQDRNIRTTHIGEDYCSYYHDHRKRNGPHIIQFDTWVEVAKLHREYLRALVLLDALHQWFEVDRVHYADNSIEATYMSAVTGECKKVMLVSPHGD